jgi:predicted nucleic acid-binding Zn ribbon protein
MPTYLYETVPAAASEPVEQFELKQHFDEAPLTVHPDTGTPVRRVISGGIGLVTHGTGETSLPDAGPACGPDSCCCGRYS